MSQSLKLVVDRLGDKKHWEIPLVEKAAARKASRGIAPRLPPSGLRFRMNYDWDLAKLANANLKPGDVLEYYLLVTDNFSLAGQSSRAGRIGQAAHLDHQPG